MNVTASVVGVTSDVRTPFERWVEDEIGLELLRGYAVGGIGRLPLRRWQQRNLDAVFVDLIGAESLAGMYVAELRPGESSARFRVLCDETFYVLRGNGATAIETPGGTMAFEWGERSLFAIPLNCPYTLYNGSGTEPARLISVNTLPIVYSLYRDPAFVFGCDHHFARFAPRAVVDPTAGTLYKPDEKHLRTAVDLYDAVFIPDILRLERTPFRERGGGNTIYVETAQSAISCHVAQHPGPHFNNPHRHGPSAWVFTLGGCAYTLMWPDGGEIVRFDWDPDDLGVVVPPNMWWHGHFVTSSEPVTMLAVKLRSRFNPINHLFDKTHIRVAEGGTVLRFDDLEASLRRRLWDTFAGECAKHDVSPPVARA